MDNLLYVVAVGLPVWLVMVGLGRQLRQRLSVRMGAPYHFICIANATLAASYFMTLKVETHRVITAAAYMMDALLLLTLFNRFYWEDYFAKKRNMVVPRFFTHATRLIGITAAAVLVLQFVFDVRVPGIIASLGGLGLAIGLALQPVISNLTAGLTIQLSKPLKQGDWIYIDGRISEVMELNWRTTRLRTADHTCFEITNVDLLNTRLQNYSYPTPRHAMRVTVPVESEAPPNKVRSILLRATTDVPNVLESPAPEVYLKEFTNGIIVYEIRVWIENDAEQDRIADSIRTDAWYGLQRADLTMPFPRVVQYPRPKDNSEALAWHIAIVLGRNMILAVLNDEQRQKLAVGARKQLFGKGERIFHQGEEGSALYVVVDGEADVVVESGGHSTRVNTVRSGECLGEFSLLTGEKHTATVVTTKDTEVVLIPRKCMAEVLRESPELMEKLSQILALRRLENEVILAESQSQRSQTEAPKSQDEYANDFLNKMRDFFSV